MNLYIFAAILAISLAREIKKEEVDSLEEPDLEAAASVELLKSSPSNGESLDTAASTYNYVNPSQRPPRPWNPPSNYIPNPPQNTWNNPQNNYNPVPPPPVNNYVPTAPQIPQNDYIPPQNNYQPPPPQNNYQPSPPFNNYQPSPPQNNYQPSPPLNNYQPSPPQNNYQPSPPLNNYQPPQNNYQPSPPQNNYRPNPPVGPSITPQENPQNPQNDYYVAVIKNEQYIGENGNYKYEYQIGDGTHVGEVGYLVNPNTDNESVVKKGWYSYVGGDGRLYTVRWYADDTGYHAFGDHLPTPPPVPPAIQAALDQAAKEEANKPTQPTYQPSQPTYYPTTAAPAYYPQQTYYPNNNYGK